MKILILMLMLVALAIPIAAQSEPSDAFAFAGGRYDNGAYLVSVGALFDKVELVPGLVGFDVGPLSSIWYTDVFSTLWKDQPEKTANLSFELAVHTTFITDRLTVGLTLGSSFEQQEEEASIADYLTAATGGLAAYNWAKSGYRPWGPWAYIKYKSGLSNDYRDGFQGGLGLFYNFRI